MNTNLRALAANVAGLGLPFLFLAALPAQSVNTWFTGANQCGQGRLAFDISVAVGDQVVQTVNSTISIFNRNGTRLLEQPLQGSSGFFANSTAVAQRVVQPRVILDPISQRFMAVGIEVDPTNPAVTPGVWVAYSTTSNPLGAWTKTKTPGVVTIGGQSYVPDYSGLAYTQSHCTYSGMLFPPNPSAPYGSIVRVFRRSDLLNRVIAGCDIYLPGRTGYEALAPVSGPTSQVYLIGTVAGMPQELRLQAVNLGQICSATPTMMETRVTLNQAANPSTSNAPQGDTASTLVLEDGRLQSAVYDASTDSIYTCHTVLGGAGNMVRWYQIKVNGWPAVGGTPVLVQQGDINATVPWRDLPGNFGAHTYTPAITAAGNGMVGLTFTRSAADENPRFFVTGRSSCDPRNTMRVPREVGFTSNGLDYMSTPRWGDYQAAAADPFNPGTFWFSGAVGAGATLCNGTFLSTHWSTRIASVTVLTECGVTGFGTGWPGTGGSIPSLGMSPGLRIGATSNVTIGNSLGAATLGSLMISTRSAAGLPTPFGGSLFVDPAAPGYLTLDVPVPAAGANVPMAVPYNIYMIGVPLYFQAVELDAGASAGLSFTPALFSNIGQ